MLLGGIAGVIVGGDQQSANCAMQGAGNAIVNNDINHYPNNPSAALRASGYGATIYSDGTICNFQSATGAGCTIPGSGTPSQAIGYTVGASTFVGDYSLTYAANGALYLGGGKTINLAFPFSMIASGNALITIADSPMSAVAIDNFFVGSSIQYGVQTGLVTSGTAYSPNGYNTFQGATTLGIAVPPGMGASAGTGMSWCIWNCPGN